MANTTVSTRERIKTPERCWRWSQNLRPQDDKLQPSQLDRKGKFSLVWTEEGKKREQGVKGNFEAAVKAARAKERHLEDAADGFERPDPLKKKAERITIADAIEIRLHSIEVTFERDTLKSHRQALRQFERHYDPNLLRGSHQVSHAHQVVGCASESKYPIELQRSAMPHLAQPGNRLQPPKTFLDALSFLLADAAAGMLRRAPMFRHSRTNSAVSNPLSPPTVTRPVPGICCSMAIAASRSAVT